MTQPLFTNSPNFPTLADRRDAVVAYLVEHNNVDPLTLSRASTVAERARQPLELTLNQMGVVSDEAVTRAYAAVGTCRIWDPQQIAPAMNVSDLNITKDYLREKRLLPLVRVGSHLMVAACDPLDDEALAGLCFATGLTIEILAANPVDWRRAFAEVYGEQTQTVAIDERKVELDLQSVADTGSESDPARLVSSVFEMALAQGASDIHFEPRRHDLRIRLRIDGRLVDTQLVSADLSAPVVSRIKVLASLDLGERRLPQDGRATFVVTGRPIDVRISILPSAFGEAAVLRLLDRTASGFGFADLGFAFREAEMLARVVHMPHGIFLVTGPTGSGKTTTLYALLNSLSNTEKKILSIEDPVEYHFQHVVQTQAAPAIGLTFAAALRSFLRQDPDVILVGEIRDAETAQVAIQAAMTGHLVLASLHANDAIRVVPRLLDMGLEPYQLAAAMLGSVAQRLVRKLCPKCSRKRDLSAVENAFIAVTPFSGPAHAFDAVGCSACAGAGYRGRIALVEGFLFNSDLSAAVAQEHPAEVLSKLASRDGFKPMVADGFAKVGQGLTTFSEVMSCIGQ